MSHFTVVVALPESSVAAVGINESLNEVLAPYNENREVERYVKYTKEEAIAKEREEIIDYRDNGLYAEYLADPEKYVSEHGHHESHIEYLLTGFPEKLTHLDDEDWLYEQAIRWEEPDDLDDKGGITSTYNPKSKWDWWVIGGRWSKTVFNATPLGMKKDEFFGGEYEYFEEDGVDVVQVENLNKDTLRAPYAFVDLEGNWNEKGEMGWFGMSSNEMDQEDWDAVYRRFVESLDPGTTLVLVDAHI